MFDNLQTQLISNDDLESGFGDGKDDKKKTTKTDSSKKTDDKTDKGKKNSSKGKTELATDTKDSLSDLPKDDIDLAFGNEDNDDEETQDDDVKDDKKGKKKKDEEVSDNEDDETEDVKDNEDDEEDKEKDNEDDETEDDSSDDIKDFLKARVELLIKKGEWADFDDREKVEWTEDVFADMELQQRDFQKRQMTEDILESFGPYGKEIAQYTANGGDPDKLIDIFKEQQRVDSLSVDTEEAQRAVVMKYETEFLNKKPERVKKYIDSLIADKELEDVAKEAKEAMEENLNQRSQDLKNEQLATSKRAEKAEKDSIEKFQSDVSSLVSKSEDIPADEKKQILQVLTKFDKKLKNGKSVNEFYFKFDQFRKDLPNYIKLVRLVLNPDKFIKSIENSGKTAATDKAFKLMRGAAKSKKLKSSDTSSKDQGSAKTKFKLF